MRKKVWTKYDFVIRSWSEYELNFLSWTMIEHSMKEAFLHQSMNFLQIVWLIYQQSLNMSIIWTDIEQCRNSIQILFRPTLTRSTESRLHFLCDVSLHWRTQCCALLRTNKKYYLSYFNWVPQCTETEYSNERSSCEWTSISICYHNTWKQNLIGTFPMWVIIYLQWFPQCTEIISYMNLPHVS